jgi:hypothetical protein
MSTPFPYGVYAVELPPYHLFIDFGSSVQGKLKRSFQNLHYLFVPMGMQRNFGSLFHIPKSDAHILGMDKFAMIAGHDFFGRDIG